jgi:transposase InsO family protein
MSKRHAAGLATDALHAAVATRGRGTMHDASHDLPHRHGYRAHLGGVSDHLPSARAGPVDGPHRVACLDTVAAESFFAALKVELVGRRRYRTRAEARAPIFAWIAWYNQRRLHSTNGDLPPAEWEQHDATSTNHHPRWPQNPSVRPPGGSPPG